jgi:hypothetical protein
MSSTISFPFLVLLLSGNISDAVKDLMEKRKLMLWIINHLIHGVKVSSSTADGWMEVSKDNNFNKGMKVSNSLDDNQSIKKVTGLIRLKKNERFLQSPSFFVVRKVDSLEVPPSTINYLNTIMSSMELSSLLSAKFGNKDGLLQLLPSTHLPEVVIGKNSLFDFISHDRTFDREGYNSYLDEMGVQFQLNPSVFPPQSFSQNLLNTSSLNSSSVQPSYQRLPSMHDYLLLYFPFPVLLLVCHHRGDPKMVYTLLGLLSDYVEGEYHPPFKTIYTNYSADYNVNSSHASLGHPINYHVTTSSSDLLSHTSLPVVFSSSAYFNQHRSSTSQTSPLESLSTTAYVESVSFWNRFSSEWKRRRQRHWLTEKCWKKKNLSGNWNVNMFVSNNQSPLTFFENKFILDEIESCNTPKRKQSLASISLLEEEYSLSENSLMETPRLSYSLCAPSPFSCRVDNNDHLSTSNSFNIFISNFNNYINNYKLMFKKSYPKLIDLLEQNLLLLLHDKSIRKEKKLKKNYFNKSVCHSNGGNSKTDSSEDGLFDNIFCNQTNWILIFIYLSIYG